MRTRDFRASPLTHAELWRILCLSDQGLSHQKIADHMNLQAGSIHRWLKRAQEMRDRGLLYVNPLRERVLNG